MQIFHVLSYEAHPGLWYICLWVFSRLHVSYAGMHWVAAAIGFSGVAVLVTTSPFPRFIKLLLPFTFYLAFQYAIVARSYVLAPLLIFLCAYFWPQKLERPLTIALCLGLLANVAAHAAAISGGFAIVYLIDLWLSRHEQCPRAPAKRLYAAAVMLLVFYGLSIWTALPAKDASGAVLVVRPNAAQSEPIEEQDSQIAAVLSWCGAGKQKIDRVGRVEGRMAALGRPDSWLDPTLLARMCVLGVADMEVLQDPEAALSSARLLSGRVVSSSTRGFGMQG